MKITLVNSDVISSYKSSHIAHMCALSVFKNKFFKLISTERRAVYAGCANSFLQFNSPINDGWLNSNKAVADFFFSEYKYGENHWSGKLDHAYPFVRLYPFDAQEAAKYAKYIDTYEIEQSVDESYYAYAPCNNLRVLISTEEGSLEERYLESGTKEYVRFVYNHDLAVDEAIPYTAPYTRYFIYNLEKLRTMSGVEFQKWLLVSKRVDFEIEKESGSWYESSFFSFALSLTTGGIWGAFTFVLTRVGTSYFTKEHASSTPTAVENKNSWSSDENEEEDDILAVKSLPKY